MGFQIFQIIQAELRENLHHNQQYLPSDLQYSITGSNNFSISKEKRKQAALGAKQMLRFKREKQCINSQRNRGPLSVSFQIYQSKISFIVITHSQYFFLFVQFLHQFLLSERCSRIVTKTVQNSSANIFMMLQAKPTSLILLRSVTLFKPLSKFSQ